MTVEPDPGWRREIRECSAPHCALWRLRPYQQTTETDDPDPPMMRDC